MPLTRYEVVPRPGTPGRVCAALSRFRNITVELLSSQTISVWVATESQAADEAWRQLIVDLRDVEQCSLVEQDPECSSLEAV